VNNSFCRVLFDSEAFCQHPHGGIARYFSQLIPRLPTYGVQPTLVLPVTINQHVQRGAGVWVGGHLPVVTSVWVRRAVSAGCLITDSLLRRVVRWDVVHHTYYNRQVTTSVRTSCTVHDMIPELLPEEFSGVSPHGRKLTLVRGTDLVLAVSETTKTDLLRLVPGLRARVYVTPLAVDRDFFDRHSRGTLVEPGRYVLFVGARGGYKNFARFAEAMAGVLLTHADVSLVCVGGGQPAQEEIEPFRRLNLHERVRWRRATDVELAALYGHAECFVFPSRYEGFGLPILESMASGCPVALSAASCFPEVAENAAQFFDPLSVDSIAAAIDELVQSGARKRELRELGFQRLRAFSWERTAELTAQAFRGS
jgi:glycosyltransferase involved in cell wall biosynthesis